MKRNNKKITTVSEFINGHYALFLILCIIAIFVFTFKNPDPDYGVGLDASYVWGYNMLFAENYNALLDFVYPLGPLFVLKTPTVQSFNLIVYLVFYTVIKLLFLLCFFLTARQNKVNKAETFLLAYVASFYITVDYLILFTCALLCMAYLRQRKVLFLVLSSALAATGFCIKSSIGISSFAVIGFSWIGYLYMYRNWRQSALQLMCIVLPFVVIGCLVFKGFLPFVNYINGTLHLVLGYGSTLALYPQNTWAAVAIGLAAWAAYPFLKRNVKLQVFFLMMLIPFFSVFKHAFIREDIWHYQQIVYFLLTYWAVAVVLGGRLKTLGAVLGIVSVGCFVFNARNLDYFSHLKPDFRSVEYFADYYFHYNKTEQYYQTLNSQSLKADVLPARLVNTVGKSSVDCYPWEHLYAKANNLNWKPRKTIELGASTSAWTSSLAVENYKGVSAAEFVIWHLQKNEPEKTIDGRYFLNDEPLVVQALLSNYDIADTAGNCMLLKHNPSTQGFVLVKQSDVLAARLNEWTEVPYDSNAAVRAKIFAKHTFKGGVKAVLLKDAAFFIDYKALDGTVYTYRYQPFAATQGLWVNPLVLFDNKGAVLSEIKQIRIRTNNDGYVKNDLQLQFEMFKIKR